MVEVPGSGIRIGTAAAVAGGIRIGTAAAVAGGIDILHREGRLGLPHGIARRQQGRKYAYLGATAFSRELTLAAPLCYICFREEINPLRGVLFLVNPVASHGGSLRYERPKEADMIVRSLLVAVVLVAFSAPASAFYCPNTGKAITAALGNAKLSAAQKAEAEKLRDQGMAQHNAGDHKAAVISLAESARIILNSMGM